MKLDRYLEPAPAAPKYRVFKTKPDGSLGDEADPWDCFVIKRKDLNSDDALTAYASSAFKYGDEELANDVCRLRDEWRRDRIAKGDAKLPD
jgi:hypothetical protein